MAFIDTRLSDQVSFGFSGGPRWDTLIKQLENGRERRKGKLALPLHEFDADYALLDDDGKAEVLSAFWVTRGSLNSFRFLDWNDFRALPANAVGAMSMLAPATTTTPIQLSKTYTFGPTNYVRDITLPLDVALFFDGVAFTDFTVDPLTGIATPTTAWPTGTPSWTGTHDVRVRFGKDFNPFTRARPKVSTCMVQLFETLD